MSRNTNILVGFFVLSGLSAFLSLALKASNLLSVSSADRYAVVAYFDNIGGLKPRAAVRSAGVLVGRVKTIDLDDTRYQAVVTLEIDARYNFPRDSSAQILTSGLLGENYIGLLPGAESDSLKGGDRIVLTQSALGLENVISQFLYNRDTSGAGAGQQGLARP